MKNIEELCRGISVNTQSSIRVSCRVSGAEKVFYFDPLGIAGEPHDADVVFVTHSHGDHYSPDDIAKIAKEGTVLVCPEQMGVDGALAVVPGKRYEAGGIAFETVAAYNKLKPFHPKHNGWVGYIAETDLGRIYAAGDTDAVKEAEAVRCDIALVPVGGKYTMNAAEAAELVNKINPAAAIPTHYGTIVGSAGDGDVFAGKTDGGIAVVKKLKF